MRVISDILARLREWTRALFMELGVLWLAFKDPRISPLARVLAFVTLAYAISPIDLIPDFIPVLGQLDDLIIVPLGAWLCLRLIAPDIRQELRTRLAHSPDDPAARPPMHHSISLGIVLLTWALILLYLFWKSV